jgi:hypothetical protein
MTIKLQNCRGLWRRSLWRQFQNCFRNTHDGGDGLPRFFLLKDVHPSLQRFVMPLERKKTELIF